MANPFLHFVDERQNWQNIIINQRNVYFNAVLKPLAWKKLYWANNNDTNTSKKQPKNQQKRRKVCTICNIAPPLRSHHCKICNKCVATFDHHCGFVGTCIGERNHCRFYWFLFIQALGFLKCISVVNESKFGFICFVWQIV